MTKVAGARYEIAIDGTPRSHRDREDYAIEIATYLKAKLPKAEITPTHLPASAVLLSALRESHSPKPLRRRG
jgi:hypothetical protein